jgi:hypothetical protein
VRLTDAQIELYSRQIILREVGGTGQTALRAARVAVLGSGPAAEVCTSYLVGAGIGRVDVGRGDATAPPAPCLPLPAPGRRTPDATLGGSGVPPPDGAAPAPYDVVLDLAPWRAAAGGRAPYDGTDLPARLGRIVLRGDARAALRVLLLPAGTSCPRCVAGAGEPLADAPPAADRVASASAGALAALACLRWILGIGGHGGTRVLALAADRVGWVEDAPPERVPCPRGCPPAAHPV